jgi:mannose-6-phosphate isomerase-like protein (cupin superfamily)
MTDHQVGVIEGNGWKAGNIAAMGGGPGFKKIRRELGVTEMGVNAIVLPVGIGTGTHWHDSQEEVYFVHEGTLRFTLGENDEDTVTLGPGGVIRIAPETHRGVANVGDVDATYVVFGAAGGYVGRDASHREDQPRVIRIET